MNIYTYRGGKQLRCGYTTGSCAAGAAKAAAEMLLSGIECTRIELMTPAGVLLNLDIHDIKRSRDTVSCAVIKDSGDDPDATRGISVYATVSKCESGIIIEGGEGIGIVTKPGLDQPVGSPAINSGPRRMITEAVLDTAEKYRETCGFRIVISAPQGIEIAKKTFNPRMGIEGGISIIGTTGIVEPMSNQAIVDTIRTEANMRKAAGEQTLILTVGNYSEHFVSLQLPDLSARCVMCNNFIGEAVDIGIALGFRRILLIGHIGKLVKLGSGIMHTHSSYADGRMETFIACAALAGAPLEVLQQINSCVTTDAALDILSDCSSADKTLSILTERIAHYLNLRTKGEAEIGAVIFSDHHNLILKTANADSLLQSVTEA